MHKNGEMTVSDIHESFDVSKSSISHFSTP
ncbi:ArsR family transcriptional regulator [Macrococcus capreoli]